jgi:choline dehydrogenase-like flavoprotein
VYDDKTNRATGVQVIDEKTLDAREYKAKMIFMCASTIGTAQIMLNSKSSAFPTGIANSSGALGHYLMDHVYNSSAVGELDGFEDDYYRGNRPTGPIIPRFRNLEKQDEDFSRGYFLRGGSQRMGALRGAGSLDFGKDFKNEMQGPGKWIFRWAGSGEMLPRYENHVALDEKKTDKWGIPQLNINCKWSDNEYKMMEKMADDCVEMLEAIGAKNIKRQVTDAPPGLAIHEMGIARMGKDPKDSVLNGNNQCHDVPNLFVTDGACMASCSHPNPSLTYMAISARAANIAAGLLKSKKI